MNAVTTAGSFNVDYVTGSWAESTIDHSNAPPLGSAIASNVAITTADKNQYILINVTSAVQAWLSGSEKNNGIALVANSTFNASFDSKENTTTSHPAELDIVFAGSGGGGSGTVSSVGLSAPSSDFTVSGSPVTTSGTLGLTWTVAPTNADTANAIVKRDATGSFNATSVDAVASNGNAAVLGYDSSGGGAVGVAGLSNNGQGVYGSSNTSYGVYGLSSASWGVYGLSLVSDGVYGVGPNVGVYGSGASSSGFGVYGTGLTGVAGISNGNYAGVYGASSGSGSSGVLGLDSSGTGVYGSGSIGVYGQSGTGGIGVNAVNTGTGYGLIASSNGFCCWAGWFNGNVEVDGNLSKAGGSFKIDHPLDPANKYLYHSFVESPDMMNIYNGNVTTDAQGDAVVDLPDWFETLNRDFRYQLTVIGQFAQAIVSTEIADGRFSIKTDKPNVKVSWQVTGIRQDAWANAHRIPVEEEKPEVERGFYLHPELYGAPEEKGILWATARQAMKQWKAAQAKAAASQGAGNTAKP